MQPCGDTCGQLWSLDAALRTNTGAARVPQNSAPRGRVQGHTRLEGNVERPHLQSAKGNPFRILCWILTYPKAHAKKAVYINNTWGRHCDTLMFMTTEHFHGLNTVVVNIGGPEDRGRLWNKSKESWMYTCVYP